MPEDVNIHVHVHTGGGDDEYQQILEGIQDLQMKGMEMAADLTGLINEVAEAKTVSQSAAALIAGFGAQLDAALAAAEGNAVDVAVLEDLRAKLDSSNQELQDAITANTPEVEPPVEPEVPEEPAPPVDPDVPAPDQPQEPVGGNVEP